MILSQKKIMNSKMRRKICVVLADRANYGRLKPVMKAIANHQDLELQVLVTGTMPLERFGKAVNIVEQDGFRVDGQIFVELEGSLPITMAKSIGIGIIEVANEFQRLNPDVVMIIGDKYEALAASIAAAYMNKCIVHIQGGEVSGSIDESTRHAISKFAHFHAPSTKRSAEYLIRMGEKPETILTIGCPSSDIARLVDKKLSSEIFSQLGSGAIIDISKPFLLTIFHPTTTEFGDEKHQIEELLHALNEIRIQTLLLWPNIDAGADHISKAIRVFRNIRKPEWLYTMTNVSPESYLKILSNAACVIGNSSSFVRDASYFGTPVVMIGSRQSGRELAESVVCVPNIRSADIVKAIRNQLAHGAYKPSNLYGDGYVSERIAESLAKINPYVQKKISYVNDSSPEIK